MTDRVIRQRISALPNFLVGDYDGEFWVTSYSGPSAIYQKFRIDRADPKVTIYGRFIDDIRRGPHHPDLDLDGDILRIRGTNRTVVYRLVMYVRDTGCYVAEWPD